MTCLLKRRYAIKKLPSKFKKEYFKRNVFYVAPTAFLSPHEIGTKIASKLNAFAIFCDNSAVKNSTSLTKKVSTFIIMEMTVFDTTEKRNRNSCKFSKTLLYTQRKIIARYCQDT